MRASYAESFLAPSLKQLFAGQEQGAESVDCLNNPTNPICVAFGNTTSDNFPYNEISGSNPNLKPETGKTYNLGFIFEPTPVLAVAVDFFQIKKKDEIDTLSVEDAAAGGNVGRSPQGEALVFVNNLNIAATRIQGVDVDLRVRFGNTPLGTVTVQNATTYYTKQQQQEAPGAPFDEFNGTFLFPRWRNTLRVNLESGPWAANLAVRTTSSMKDTDQPAGEPTENVGARRIDTYEELDVGLQFTGIKNLTLGAQVKNLLNRQPPYSNEGTQNQYGSLGFPWLYSPRGRFFSFTANYKFF